MIHVALAGFFMFLFVRDLSGHRRGGLVAGVLFAFSGYLTGYPPLQLAILRTAIWLPLILWLLIRAFAEPHRWRWWTGAILAYATALLAGHPQTFLHLSYAVGAWILLLFLTQRRKDAKVRILGTFAFCTLPFALSAVQWLPSWEFTQSSVRAAVDYAFVSGGFPIRDTWQMVFPDILTQFSPLYVSAVGLVLAVVALWQVAGGATTIPSPQSPIPSPHSSLHPDRAPPLLRRQCVSIPDLLPLRARMGSLPRTGTGGVSGGVWAERPRRDWRSRADETVFARTARGSDWGHLVDNLRSGDRLCVPPRQRTNCGGQRHVRPDRGDLADLRSGDGGAVVATRLVSAADGAAGGAGLRQPAVGGLRHQFERLRPGAKTILSPEMAALQAAVDARNDANLGLPGRVYNEFRVYEDYGMRLGVEDVWGSSPLRSARYARLFDNFPLDRLWQLTGVEHVLTWRRELFGPSELLAEFPQATDTTFCTACPIRSRGRGWCRRSKWPTTTKPWPSSPTAPSICVARSSSRPKNRTYRQAPRSRLARPVWQTSNCSALRPTTCTWTCPRRTAGCSW
ncbi:MAG: hypothetical protein R2856_00090 [Caldilineaceae bacterium]